MAAAGAAAADAAAAAAAEERRGGGEQLLRPIREAAGAAGVDVGEALGRYVGELEGILEAAQAGGAFPEGLAGVDFREAGLVIQGSTYHYGKRVNRLMDATFEVLQLLAARKAKAVARELRRGAAGAGGRGEGDLEELLKEEEQFLRLDECLEEAEGIDLAEDLAAGAAGGMAGGAGPQRPEELLLLEDRTEGLGAGLAADACNMRVLEVHEETGALVIDGGAGLDAQLRPIPEGALLSPGDGSPPASPQMMAPMMEDGYFSGGGSVLATPAGPSVSGGAGAPPGTGGGEEGTGRGHTGGAAGGRGAEEEEEYDPYEPLDPYAAGALKVKPFRRGLCRRQAGRKKGTEEEGLLGGAAAAPRAGLNFPEFDYALKARQRARRAEAAAAAPPGGRGGAFAPQGDWAEDPGAEGGEDPVGAGYGEEALTGPEAEALLPAVDFEIPHVAEMEAPMVDAMLGDEGAAGEDDGQSYEQLVQEHVQSFVEAASALEAQSELIHRVAEWKEKVEPALQESEKRKAFDIQEYEKDVVLTLNAAVREESGEEAVGFGALVTHVKDFEIARTFAAMLQLVNDGNVEIVKGSEGSTENFSLHLHKTSLAAERFAGYRAPSVLQERRENAPAADPASSPSPAKPRAKSRRMAAAGEVRE